MQAATELPVARSSRLAPPDFDARQVQRQAILLRMISITEAFCVDRLLDLAETDVDPGGSPIRDLIWKKASSSAVSTWSSIQDSYKSWYSLQPAWTKLNELVEVRNAIAHGLGQLTRLQRAKPGTATKIGQAGIRLSGDRVILEEADLENAHRACLQLVSEVDQLIQASTGNVN